MNVFETFLGRGWIMHISDLTRETAGQTRECTIQFTGAESAMNAVSRMNQAIVDEKVICVRFADERQSGTILSVSYDQEERQRRRRVRR